MKIHDVEQQSREWMQLHVGIPTAGGLDNLLTPEFELRKGETPKTYVYKKVAEAWRGKPMIDLGGSSFAMEQGMILESEAIPFWELTTGRKITRVGFITTDDGRFGCSPDGLIDGADFGIEVKCPEAVNHVRYLSEGILPKAYTAQVFGSMFVTGFPRWLFVSYRRGFPPLILEIQRDQKAMDAIAKAVDTFHSEFKRTRKTLERYRANPLNEFK